MRLTAGLLLALAAAAALALWASGGFQIIGWWVVQQQHAVQSALAGRLQALRAGEPAALWSLVALSAAYRFLHALGPGHGKALVAGAAMGTGATARRMALIAFAGSLGQAAVAIALVYGALAIFEATARGTVAVADRWIAPAGNLAVALIGAWILWRGLRALGAARSGAHAHDHDHGPSCGHAHGPDPAEVARATDPAATLALIAAMAARPCTGALVVLVLAWRLGLAGAGIAAVVAMGLGTAAFTVLVAVMAVASRDEAFVAAGDGRAARLLAPGLQILAGVMILGIGAVLAMAGLAA
jgi:ABC-type nickel/cobalt efflux system permease component RcnA